MASQIQSSATKLELAALGRPANREDWIRDIHLRVGICFLNSTHNELVKVAADRLRFRAAYARPGLDELMSSLENRPEGFLSELQKIREILDRCSGIDFNDSSTVAEVYYSHLESEAELMLSQQKQIAKEWQDFQTYLDASTEVVANIPRAIRTMCRETGQARAALVLELRNLFASLFTTHQDVPPVVHLSYVWVSMQTNEPSEELLAQLTLGAQQVGSSLASQFCCRLLGEMYARDGQFARAAEWTKRSLEFNPTAEAQVEMALLAAEMHEPLLAKPYVEDALTRRPSSIVHFLADERCVNLGSVFLDIVVRVQARLRRDGRQYILNWASAAKDVLDLQKSLGGMELAISHELLEGHKSIDSRLADADILTAGALVRYCEECTSELRAGAKASLEQQFDRQREVLTAARLGIDAIGVARESRIQKARDENLAQLQGVQSVVSGVTAKAKRIEKQSILWFGSGCGLFGFYLITKLVLQFAGSSVEISSEMGFVLLGIAGVPVLLSIGLQVYHGLSRASMEISIREKVSEVNKKLRQAELEADDFHRDQMAIGRKNLADAEAQLKKIEAALRAMQTEPFHPEQVSARLRVA